MLRKLLSLFKRHKPTISDIYAGSVWAERAIENQNPFKPNSQKSVSVIEVRRDWVRYGWWSKGPGGRLWVTHECPVHVFLSLYPVKVE